ncbi:MAG: hypothetical protein IKZ35_05590 [Clostridia bacterium]|nr:hypothetical protein [Clostridia bacterium]
MTKKKKITLSVLSVILILITVFVWANFDLILMVKDGLTQSLDDLNKKMEDVDKKQKDALENAGNVNVRPLNEEEKEEFSKGNLTEEEVIKIITGKTTIEEVKTKNENTEGQKPQDKQEVPGDKTTDSSLNQPSKEDALSERISELVGKVYVLEAKFKTELGALEQWAINEYVSVKREDRPAKKKELIAIGFPKLAALEKECDMGVNSILEELTKVLKDAGQNTDLVKQIKESYVEKKQLTKSYYISEYM